MRVSRGGHEHLRMQGPYPSVVALHASQRRQRERGHASSLRDNKQKGGGGGVEGWKVIGSG